MQVKFTQKDLIKAHKEMCEEARALMALKNHDYAKNNDPLRNFHMFGSFGVLVRLSDKIARLRTFEEKGFFKVKDESVKDTILDIVNYALIYHAYLTNACKNGLTPDKQTAKITKKSKKEKPKNDNFAS